MDEAAGCEPGSHMRCEVYREALTTCASEWTCSGGTTGRLVPCFTEGACMNTCTGVRLGRYGRKRSHAVSAAMF